MNDPRQTTLNTIADLHKKLAAHYEALGCFLLNTPSSPVAGNEAATVATTPAADPPKRGRPAKVETPASPVLIPKDEPKVDDTKVTAEHPDRAKLKAIAKDLIAATDKATAQSAVKLFGNSTNDIVDVQLAAACEHLSALLKKKQATNDDV